MSIIIKGIQRDGNEKLYDAVQVIGDKYEVEEIEIIIDKWTAVAKADKSRHFRFGIPPIYISDAILVNPDIPHILKKEYLEAVFAHEFSHVVNKDVGNPMDVALLLFSIFYLFIMGIPILLFTATGACFISILLVAVWFIPVYLFCRNRRIMEVRSDRDAALKTSPATMITTLKAIDEYVDNLPKDRKKSAGFARRVVDTLTHPSVPKRIELLRKLEKEINAEME